MTEETPGKDIAEDIKEELEKELKPLEVTITNHPIIKDKNPTSWDENYAFGSEYPTEEEMKEMQDAQ